MDPLWKTSNASTPIAEDNHASASLTNTRVEAKPQNEGPSPDLEHLDQEQLAAALRVDPDATVSDEDLIRRSSVKHFPLLPPDGDGVLTPGRLVEHLNSVKQTVHSELQRLNPLRRKYKVLAGLVPSYHRLAMDHVHALLKRILSSQQAFVLMEWLCNTYFSLECLGVPDFSDNKHRSPVDMHSYSEMVVRVRQTLLTTLERDVKSSLDVIIKRQESEFWRSWELHTDVIKCMNEPMVSAEAISDSMQASTRRVCSLQLQEFLQRFNTAKQELLKRYEKNPKMAVETCLKTLNTCHGLASYIQTYTDGGTRDIPAEETLSLLRTMETTAQTSMEDALVKISKDLLKRHFESREEDFLLKEMKEMFSAGGCVPDVQKKALDLAYERVSALYLWQLTSTKKKDLEKRWGRDVGQKVTQDAERVHQTFSDLHPDVSQQNHVLLKVEELIQSRDVDSVKLTLSAMMQLCQSGKYKKLWPELLKWNGDLSSTQVKDVLAGAQLLATRETSDSTGMMVPH